MSAVYNGIIPTYSNKEDELAELMNYYKFAYKPSSGYNGTVMFCIICIVYMFDVLYVVIFYILLLLFLFYL